MGNTRTMTMWRAAGATFAAVLALALGSGMGIAQPAAQPSIASPILTLDSERLLTESAAGRNIDDQIATQSAELAAENRRIEAALTEAERDLSERRASLTPEEFRAEATAFDEKVQSFREEQDAKLRNLQERSSAARLEIRRIADPVLSSIMEDTGAAVILEIGTVIASHQSVDITNMAIARLDEALRQGGQDSNIGGLDTGVADTAPAAPRPGGPTDPAEGPGDRTRENAVPGRPTDVAPLDTAPAGGSPVTDGVTIAPRPPADSIVTPRSEAGDTAPLRRREEDGG